MADETNPQAPTNRRQDTRPALQQEFFIFCCLMLVTCLFLPWQRGEEADVTPWNLLRSFNSIAASVGWIILFVLYVLALLSVALPRVRPWLGIATALAVNAAIASF